MHARKISAEIHEGSCMLTRQVSLEIPEYPFMHAYQTSIGIDIRGFICMHKYPYKTSIGRDTRGFMHAYKTSIGKMTGCHSSH